MNNRESRRDTFAPYTLEKVISQRQNISARRDLIEEKLWEIMQVANDLNIPIKYRDALGSTRKILPSRNT